MSAIVFGQTDGGAKQDTLSKFDKFNQKAEKLFKYMPAPIITYSTEANSYLLPRAFG